MKQELILISEDTQVQSSKTPPKEIREYVYWSLLTKYPYRFDEKELHKEVAKLRGKVNKKTDSYQLKRNRLVKDFGWGIHANEDGKIALVACESHKYYELQAISNIKITKGYCNKKVKLNSETYNEDGNKLNINHIALITALKKDKYIISIDNEIANSKILLHAYVEYKNQKWYPCIVNDRQTNIIGFDLNVKGLWGKNDEVGRRKIGLAELIAIYINRSIFPRAGIRCKTLTGSQKNGRKIGELKVDERLQGVIKMYSGDNMLPIISKVENNDISIIMGKSIDTFEAEFDTQRLNKVLFKSVGKSQYQDGVRINKEFHDIFNPPNHPSYVAKGHSRPVVVRFNSKTFNARYVFEGTKADRDLQRIQFNKELIAEFEAVFPHATGFFRIKVGEDFDHFEFLYNTDDAIEVSRKLEDAVSMAKEDSREDRLKRLQAAKAKPDTVQITSVAYIRNADVIAEVLLRSDGICESCGKNAPFLRKRDNTPYLEVHHKIPLSEGGFDTVDNAIALCPNCHRKLHYG